jgi:guanine deaminase
MMANCMALTRNANFGRPGRTSREKLHTFTKGSKPGSNAPWYGLRGYLLNSPRPGKVTAHKDGAVVWDNSGVITYAGPWKERPRARMITWKDVRSRLITPGFVDTHCHLPQYPAVAQGGLELLPWLQRYIFPLEKHFTPKRAVREASRFFAELKRHGITAAAVYVTACPESTEVCFQAARRSKLRIVMGQMMMDVNSYLARASRALTRRVLEESECLCSRWHGAARGRLRYAFSPRFALTCSSELMRATGQLARDTGAFIQTHLAENPAELAAVRKSFPEAIDYTHVYEEHGLLGPRTIVGHAIYLSDREYRVLRATGTKVAHCPTANLFLRSGVMDWSRMRSEGVAIGMGSDVGAGPELNPWQVMKGASYSHKLRVALTGTGSEPSLADLFRAATVGGAEILWPERKLGQIAPGFEADVTVWDVDRVDAFGDPLTTRADAELMLSKLIFRGALARVVRTYVAGEAV